MGRNPAAGAIRAPDRAVLMKGRSMELAICRWRPDVTDEAVELLRSQGVRTIEAPPSFLKDFDDQTVSANAERLAAGGVGIYACHGPFSDADDISATDPAARADALDKQKIALRHTACAGAKCMVMHPSSPVSETDAPARLDNFRKGLDELLKVAEQIGVKVAMENMLPGYLCSHSSDVRAILEEFDSPFLGICFDIGHANVGPEGIWDGIAALQDRIISFHLHDNDGTRDIHLQPPYGSIDWPDLGAKLTGANFPFPLSVECDPWNRAPLSVLLREVRAVLSGQMPIEMSVDGATVWPVCPVCRHYYFAFGEDRTCACS